MLFIVASDTACTEIEASDIREALKLGVIYFNRDPRYGEDVAAVKKPLSESERFEVERQLTISSGSFFESFGYPDYEIDTLLSYIKNMKVV